jgi:hypothetical protein
MVATLEQHPDRENAIALLAEGFDMLEEDLDKERVLRAGPAHLLGVGQRIAAPRVDANAHR